MTWGVTWARNWDFVGQLNEMRTHLARKDPASDTLSSVPSPGTAWGGNSRGLHTEISLDCAISLSEQIREDLICASSYIPSNLLPVGVRRSRRHRRIVVTCVPGRCSHPVAHMETSSRNTRRLSGGFVWLPGGDRVCMRSWTSPSIHHQHHRRPSNMWSLGVARIPNWARLSFWGGGGRELSCGISRTVPLVHLFSCLSKEKKHADATVSSLVPVSHLPPSLPSFLQEKKERERERELLLFPTRDPPVRTQPLTQYPFWKGGREKKAPCLPRCCCRRAAAFLEQDIPKQLERADIWCCALVLGPPQNGPVLSANLVIFSASLARFQL